MTESAAHVRVIEETSAYWRVLFENPPLTKSRCHPPTGSSTPSIPFQTALTWTETQRRIQALLKRGLQSDRDFEYRWPAALDTLPER